MGAVVRSDKTPQLTVYESESHAHITRERNSRLGESIKLGIDVHMEKYVVVMKIDGRAPRRPKSFKPEDYRY